MSINIETYQYGFISSYAAIGGIIADVFLIPFFAKVFRTQNKPYATITICVIFIALANLMEAFSSSIYEYAYMCMLPSVLCANLASSSMKVAFLAAVPASDTGKAQGVLGILQSVSGIIAPIYGTAVMTRGTGMSFLSVEFSRPHIAACHFLTVALLAASGMGTELSGKVKTQ